MNDDDDQDQETINFLPKGIIIINKINHKYCQYIS